MSNLQWAIVIFLSVVAVGTIALMVLAGGNQRSKQEQEEDDADQLRDVSRPASLEQRRRIRGGSTLTD